MRPGGGAGSAPGRVYVAVIGSGWASGEEAEAAKELGRALAAAGAVLVCGGLGGVMEAACRGASEAGGTTMGILPGTRREEGNPWLDVVIPTGLGEARNALVVRAADAVVAVGGEWGTLSEIALARKTGVPVVGLGTWELAREGRRVEDVMVAGSAAEAARMALEAAGT